MSTDLLIPTDKKTLPAEIRIAKETNQILLFNSLNSSKIILEENSQLTFIAFCTEGWAELASLTFEFAGSNSQLQFLAFVIGTGKSTFPFETISRHLVPETKANYLVKAAMFDSSLVDYRGNIVIEKPAQLTKTYLAHHTLLLSNKARARTVPALEIEADDVQAGHAATIGTVDDELMFYLNSRGIDKKEGKRMLISGFFEGELKMIHDLKIQEELRLKVVEALPLSN